jgi:hypothetical protein
MKYINFLQMFVNRAFWKTFPQCVFVDLVSDLRMTEKEERYGKKGREDGHS